MKIRLTLAALVAAVTCLAAAASAGAQTTQNGLVNLNLQDVTVQVPIAVAANICDLNVAVLANLVDTGLPTNCSSIADADGNAVTFGGPSGPVTQSGLVNVNVSDVTVQVPIAAAINICDVNAAVLAALSDTAGASCDATANSHANG